MKKSDVCYFFIIFILILTTYISLIYRNQIEIQYLITYIKKFNVIFLLFTTIILFFFGSKKSNITSKTDIKIILLLLIFIFFLKKLYLGFFLIVISNFIEKYSRMKYVFFISCFFYILVLCLNNFGVLEFNNIDYGMRKLGDKEIIRYALGFNHPNTAMSLLIPIFSLLYYIYYPKYKKIVVGVILIIGKIVFDLTFSRTTFLLIILFVVLIFLKDKYIEKLKLFFLLEGFFIIFITFYLPINFRDSKLGGILSGRLWFFYQYFIREKLSFFGNKGMEKIYLEFPLDNVYLRTLYENGIFGFILLVILIFIVMYILFKNKDYKAVRIFSVILMFGFMESMAFYYYYNIIYFIISDYIFKNKIGLKKGKKWMK